MIDVVFTNISLVLLVTFQTQLSSADPVENITKMVDLWSNDVQRLKELLSRDPSYETFIATSYNLRTGPVFLGDQPLQHGLKEMIKELSWAVGHGPKSPQPKYYVVLCIGLQEENELNDKTQEDEQLLTLLKRKRATTQDSFDTVIIKKEPLSPKAKPKKKGKQKSEQNVSLTGKAGSVSEEESDVVELPSLEELLANTSKKRQQQNDNELAELVDGQQSDDKVNEEEVHVQEEESEALGGPAGRTRGKHGIRLPKK
jgi:hypothetical protein